MPAPEQRSYLLQQGATFPDVCGTLRPPALSRRWHWGAACIVPLLCCALAGRTICLELLP